MKPLTSPQTVPPRLPEMHFIVPPPGHTEVMDGIFKDTAQLPVLAWRVAAKAAQILPDENLGTAMQEALSQGRTVVVWHGSKDWSPYDLHNYLGQDYECLSARLLWAQLAPSAGALNAAGWAHLVEQLNTPDDADQRLWLQSGGQQWPSWKLSEELNQQELNQQGLQAFQTWVTQNLEPSLADWDDDRDDDLPHESDAEAEAEAEAAAANATDTAPEAEFGWPWKEDLSWEAAAWLEKSQTDQFEQNEDAANGLFRLAAAPVRKGSGKAKNWEAFLHPVSVSSADDQWEGEQLKLVAKSKQNIKTEQPAANPAKVTISRPAGDRAAAYAIQLTLPSAGSASNSGQWCLWLHPQGQLPLAFQIYPKIKEEVITVPWPSVNSDGKWDDPRYQPSDDLWENIVSGTVSLDLLNTKSLL